MKDTLTLFVLKWLGHCPLSVSRALGSVVGWLMWHSRGRARRVTLENLTLCWPELSDTERDQLARRSLKETGKTAAEAAAVWQNSPQWLMRKIVEVEGARYLQEGLESGRGVLVLAPHLGNWEVVGSFLATQAPTTALYQPPRQPALDALIYEGRRRSNMELAPTNRRGVGQLLKALKRREIVGILPDQVPEPGNGGEVAPFFGQPALTMTLVHNLIQRTGCTVVSVFAERVPAGFKVVIRPADEGIYRDTVVDSVTALNRSVEECVRRAPAQYQWEYKRFRRLPADYPQRYR